jgi:hypothetical protein
MNEKEGIRILIKDQILKNGFNSFRKLNYKFSKQQTESLENYLDDLLTENMLKVENIFEIGKSSKKSHKQTKKLLDIILDLTIIGFINWGTTLYYRNILATINKGYSQWTKENKKEKSNER